MASWTGEQESKSYFSQAKVKSGFAREAEGEYLRINVQGINPNGTGGEISMHQQQASNYPNQ